MCDNFIKKHIRELLAKDSRGQDTLRNIDKEVVAPVIVQLASISTDPLVVVFPSFALAENAFKSLKEWCNFIKVSLSIRLLPEVGDSKNFIPQNEAARVKTLFEAIDCGRNFCFFASVMSCFSPTVSPVFFLQNKIELKKGREFKFEDLKRRLVELNYDNEFQVNDYGEFAVRGGMIDVYSPLSNLPARIEFWDDEVDGIRLFDPITQKTVSNVGSYTIVLRSTIDEKLSNNFFLDYFGEKEPRLLMVNPGTCKKHLEEFGDKIHKQLFSKTLKKKSVFNLLDSVESADIARGIDAKMFSVPMDTTGFLGEEIDYSNKLLCTQLRAQQIKQWLQSGYQIVLVGNGDGACEHLRKWCADNILESIHASGSTVCLPSLNKSRKFRKMDWSQYKTDPDKILIENAKLSQGIIIPDEKIVILTENEIFFIPHKRRLSVAIGDKTGKVASLESANFADIDINDYVVHLTHGIGQFLGITEIDVSGNLREVMEIEYDDEVKLYVPTWQAGLVSRYIGSRKTAPKLNKIGGTRWEKLKVSAMRSTQNMAIEMIGVQAARASCKGYKFPHDDHEQNIFEKAFPFYETADQDRSSEELKKDMCASKPMDRLLCGDVGYGKTEVAMRGAFKAVMDGKQVAILVPTTILAQQHYYSFIERFAEYPVIIEMLSRFKTRSEQTKILEKLKDGKIDIIIGTHRLIQGDVQFSSLGLLVIDEEQRFGVTHKEKLKKLRTTVDILTMTATPIPRTLYFAMSGMRDLSTIMTAPSERLPIQTTVCHLNEKIIVNAILQEVQRGGQVFYVHNRVKTIEGRCRHLEELLPNVSFGIGHGQMHEHELEDVMASFIDGKIDVLVCTTIIESGVDIPNANTIIIERADRFGLAELYQLRGRVGRWTKQAYAYLLLPAHNILTKTARDRLSAIRRYTQLGAGLRLALKDLEIRGAGNLLGAQQSGHINAIGFELYCQLLKASISKIKGKKKNIILPIVDLTFDFVDFGLTAGKNKLTAGFSAEYIPSERLRIDFYRRFSSAVAAEEISELRGELEDRFGKIPKEANNFIRIMKLRLNVALAGYSSLRVTSMPRDIHISTRSMVDLGINDGLDSRKMDRFLYKYVFIEGDGKKMFLRNGKVPKLKATTPLQMLKELEKLCYLVLTRIYP